MGSSTRPPHPPAVRPTTSAAIARITRQRRRVRWVDRHLLILVGLVAVSVALSFAWPAVWPVTLLAVPLVLANFWLDSRRLPWFVGLVFVLLVMLVPRLTPLTLRQALAFLTIVGVGVILLVSSSRRSALGVSGASGEHMLLDLRDRIQSQSALPELPRDWYAETVVRSAGGTKFAGDFVVAARSGDHLQLALVDVSGSGTVAGTRALTLAGALGGLLGALPPSEFLAAANTFLLRQEWGEGFATAVHLSLCLGTGCFELRSAGHPPPVQLRAGSGRWAVLAAEGPILGLVDGASYPPRFGVVESGDAVLLYSDGLVERHGQDLDQGIDRLLGLGERLLPGRMDRGATRLIDSLGDSDDDRALLLVHRR